MASEKLRLTQFSIDAVVRDSKLIIPWVVVGIVVGDPTGQVWLQVGRRVRKRIELASGFKDVPQQFLRRGPLVEIKAGKSECTRRTAFWINIRDLEGNTALFSENNVK